MVSKELQTDVNIIYNINIIKILIFNFYIDRGFNFYRLDRFTGEVIHSTFFDTCGEDTKNDEMVAYVNAYMILLYFIFQI